jgi:DNA-binding transcriptional LysR family regulator
MELRQLTYFVAVAEELHFGRAAARVHIAQPALSTQIQALERELGVRLLVRTTRRVELTVAGETFNNRCARILSVIDLSAEVTRSVAGKTARKIQSGTIYPAMICVQPAFLSKVARKYRDVQLQIKSGSTSDIIRNLESGQINLGFIRPVENIGSLRFFSMASDEYLLAVTKDSRLADLEGIGIEDLRDQKSMSFSRQNLSFTERYFAEIFAEPNITRNIAYSYDDTFLLISLVSAALASALRRNGPGISPIAISRLERWGCRFQDRHGGCLEYGGPDRCPRRHYRYCTLVG